MSLHQHHLQLTTSVCHHQTVLCSFIMRGLLRWSHVPAGVRELRNRAAIKFSLHYCCFVLWFNCTTWPTSDLKRGAAEEKSIYVIQWSADGGSSVLPGRTPTVLPFFSCLISLKFLFKSLILPPQPHVATSFEHLEWKLPSLTKD